MAPSANAVTSTSSGQATPLEISGWIPYWRTATGTQDVIPHLSQLKAVMPFVYTVKIDGTLHDAGDIDGETWTAFIAAAHKNKVRVIPTVMWGNGEAIHATLSDTTKRIALEDTIANLVKEKGFDGIDIDFEAKKPETINYFSTFLRGLYQRMGNKWVYCAIEARMPLADRYDGTPPPDATRYANDYVQINKYCDRVEIMAYDQGTIAVKLNKLQPGPYAPVADVAWVERVVNLAAKTIAKKKILIGIPTYGYEYRVTPLTSSNYQYKTLWPFNPTYANNLAAKLGISPVRNSSGELSFSYVSSGNYSPTGDQMDMAPSNTFRVTDISYSDGLDNTPTAPPFNFVTWSDAKAVADKVALARKLGVRGVAVFKFDGGEDPQMWNILK